MNKELPSKVEMQENGILLSEALFEGNSDKTYEVLQLGRNVLVQPQSFSAQVRGVVSNTCYCTIDTFLKMLEGLRSNKFSGSVHTDMGIAIKTLYFNKGELVFASSNLWSYPAFVECMIERYHKGANHGYAKEVQQRV